MLISLKTTFICTTIDLSSSLVNRFIGEGAGDMAKVDEVFGSLVSILVQFFPLPHPLDDDKWIWEPIDNSRDKTSNAYYQLEFCPCVPQVDWMVWSLLWRFKVSPKVKLWKFIHGVLPTSR